MRVALEQARRPIGDGLLPSNFGHVLREELADGLAASYSAIQRTSAGNHLLWQALRQDFQRLRAYYESLGFEAPPLAWDALWKRVDLPVPSSNAVAHSQLVEALATDYGTRFCQHVEYRLAKGGNVHASCRGPTGSGKSSCMISLMDWICPIPRGRLQQRLAFDVHELPRKLGGLDAGESLLLDEMVATTGEGSRANSFLLDNLEDTLRASQRNLFVASPGPREHSAMQVDLECIAWSPLPSPAELRAWNLGKDQAWDVCMRCTRSTGTLRIQALHEGRCRACSWRPFSVFLAWVEGIPMGVVALPWCPADLYEEYAPWKEANVQRSLAGRFNDNEQTAKAVMQLFEDPRFVEYLWIGVNKPKMTDLNTGIVLFYPGMLTQAQVERMAKFAYEQLYAMQRFGATYGQGQGMLEKFRFFFGVTPNAGFLKIATKCYEE